MTPEIHLHVLASGSKGNAALIEGPGGIVLVDDGISRKALLTRADELGVDPGRIVGVILTHEHSDHVGGLSVFCNRFDGPLFATAGTAGARRYLTELPFVLVGHSDEFEVAGMRVRTFPTSHDVADPVGLRFSTEDDALGFCTDTGELGEEALDALAGTRILALESNHDERMLATGDYPAYLKARVGGPCGHLSNAQAAEALVCLVGEDTETVVAMHLSQENNRPSVCVRTLAEAMGAQVGADDEGRPEARTKDGRLTICCAAQDWPMSVW
ncbi:MBL fold metallo-hydrolase [Thermophilibacter provencensis]|uniref:MBL fold metallo-hydrolase n=1 Tax=Thermophilibacter provencensis TaxID=1852386 RepID=A0ABT7V2Q8_9ACTN|nr:MBL fold metallo-hydrolase [Thermophilibacter provencensis]MDM8270761.1 MBL fold metallo-hydrolase [Thermophilibacter provencensis]